MQVPRLLRVGHYRGSGQEAGGGLSGVPQFQSVTLFPPAEGGGEGLAKWAGTRFLGRIPMFTAVEQAGEKGECVINQGGSASVVVSKIVNEIVALVSNK
ncbi:uncharacterized protein [Blastocystis hominis]|uniref:Uncharacterized protein n=1 Tax=Blastocystis hominis TaxID=12968 RepID=D8M9L9_BLAHO|nr:uncharacterized protein [Blastocystis hominis]CBK24758.2 unnamed protein product [Blastocystis hominis]|eukprot:XP_012898806.1 uncharacterized protein [Blastocystis hominis]